MDATQSSHRRRTLFFVSVLHAFTHVYQVALLPLYLPIQKDFKLQGIEQATLLVTVMMIAYFLPSYGMGVLADRFSRKKLLGWGLAFNALGFIGLALAPSYPMAIATAIACGLGGSFYHPAATALVARLYPVGTGKALGLAGIGASVGFFIGPVYAGWRVQQTGNWRAPILELGILGLVCAGLFAWMAEDDHATAAQHREQSRGLRTPMFPTAALWGFFLMASLCFSLRDFTGSSMGSLGSLFLQHAHQYKPAETGLAISGIFLASAISNPLFGHLSDSGRHRWTLIALTIAAVLVLLFPHVPSGAVIPMFLTYGFFFMASYPMVEAALMESVPDAVRGRVFGLFITIGGFVGNLSHWLVGRWVEHLGKNADSPRGYFGIYAVLALLIIISLLGLKFLHAIRSSESELPGKSTGNPQA
ncbi:MAG TPA: MFS transporter [Roseimicrobium sp.]|nr:MFS transporter [Roseimicrobium sp.]